MRRDCLVSSLSFLGLINRQRAEILSHGTHTVGPDRETETDFIIDKLHDFEFERYGIEYEITNRPFSTDELIFRNLYDFKVTLSNNSGTIVSSVRENGLGHTFVITKDNTGELLIIDSQFDPILIQRGDLAITHYLQQFNHCILFFRGPVIDSSHVKNPKIKVNVKDKGINLMKIKTANNTRNSFFQ